MVYIAQYFRNEVTRFKIRKPEYAGKPLESLKPKCNRLMNWVIRRRKRPNDYQRLSRTDNGIVYSPNKYRETEGRKVYTPIKTWSKERKEEFKMRQWEHING